MLTIGETARELGGRLPRLRCCDRGGQLPSPGRTMRNRTRYAVAETKTGDARKTMLHARVSCRDIRPVHPAWFDQVGRRGRCGSVYARRTLQKNGAWLSSMWFRFA
jgi:hypothetical protein